MKLCFFYDVYNNAIQHRLQNTKISKLQQYSKLKRKQRGGYKTETIGMKK